MNRCPVAESISIHYDEPEQMSANDYLTMLTLGHDITINDTNYSLDEIVDSIDIEYLRTTVYNSIMGDVSASRKALTNRIAEIMK